MRLKRETEGWLGLQQNWFYVNRIFLSPCTLQEHGWWWTITCLVFMCLSIILTLFIDMKLLMVLTSEKDQIIIRERGINIEDNVVVHLGRTHSFRRYRRWSLTKSPILLFPMNIMQQREIGPKIWFIYEKWITEPNCSKNQTKNFNNASDPNWNKKSKIA